MMGRNQPLFKIEFIMSQSQCLQCRELIRQFTHYREQVIVEKESMRKQIEKCKQQLQKFMGKIDKRVDSRINEERLVNNHNLEKLQSFHQQEINKMQGLAADKDRLIEQMRGLLRASQRQRKELIYSNTKILVQMSKQMDQDPVRGQGKQEKQKSYWQLMKMYQFLIEQNNDLKKEVYLLQKNNVVKHHQDRSGIDSEQKVNKSPTIYSSTKPDNLNLSKSYISKQAERQKPIKKIPKSKQHK